MSADVQLDDVWIRFGDFVAAREADIHIEDGEFFSFLGPSGCGKTTLLRAVSGFLTPSRGRVLIGGKDMAGIGPNRRPTALIFQNLALFPLMKVWENIAFALEVQGVGKVERRRRADELLDLIALPGQGDKQVGELSGGQRQRVAIARALAAEPDVLLLDEPLSALDLKLRQHMRTELRAIQQRVGITFIYITHDQGEALTMSDHVAVMCEGRIEQVGNGTAIYDAPNTAFVASFVGENNVFEGTVRDVSNGSARVDTLHGELRARTSTSESAPLKAGDACMVFVRPESLRMLPPGDAPGRAAGSTFFQAADSMADLSADSADNRLSGEVRQRHFEGNLWHVEVGLSSGTTVTLSALNDGHVADLPMGGPIAIGFPERLAIALPHGRLAAE